MSAKVRELFNKSVALELFIKTNVSVKKAPQINKI